MIESAFDRPLHALNHYYGRGFLLAFGYHGPEHYRPKGRRAKAAAIEQFRRGHEEGKVCRALSDPA